MRTRAQRRRRPLAAGGSRSVDRARDRPAHTSMATWQFLARRPLCRPAAPPCPSVRCCGLGARQWCAFEGDGGRPSRRLAQAIRQGLRFRPPLIGQTYVVRSSCAQRPRNAAAIKPAFARREQRETPSHARRWLDCTIPDNTAEPPDALTVFLCCTTPPPSDCELRPPHS